MDVQSHLGQGISEEHGNTDERRSSNDDLQRIRTKKGPFGWFGVTEKEDASKDRFGYTQNFNSRIELEAWIDEHVMTTELRRRLNHMPFVLYGMHRTGYEVCLGAPVNLADWWYEYEDENGDIRYFR